MRRPLLYGVLLSLVLACAVIVPVTAGEGNRQGGGRQAAECDEELALYHDDRKLWSRDASEVAAMPDSRLLNEGRKNAAKGIELRLLLPAEATIRSVEIIACRGKTQTLPVADLNQIGRAHV